MAEQARGARWPTPVPNSYVLMSCPSNSAALPQYCPSDSAPLPQYCPSDSAALPQSCPSDSAALPQYCPSDGATLFNGDSNETDRVARIRIATMLDEDRAQELLGFLTLETRADIKGRATEYVLGLTGSPDGRRLLVRSAGVLRALVTLTEDASRAVARDCYLALVNLSADETAHSQLVGDTSLLPTLLSHLSDPACHFSAQICSILSNLSRKKDTCAEVFHAIESEGPGLAKVVDIFCAEGDNKIVDLHYLGPLLSNLTQLPDARRFVLDKDRCVVQRLLPYTQFEGSNVRRGGVVGTLRNCCFDHCLPIDLQYLPEDKQREQDPDIRKMLLEAINL
uniref:protein HGH1 homolog n=1 Tax=Pristiophorus japonicus TaxID=55135 RepID=UPI00398F5766